MERTWAPKRQGEDIQGRWRTFRLKDDGSQDLNYVPPFIESDEGDLVWLPSDPTLNSHIEALEFEEGDRVYVRYDGEDRYVIHKINP